MLFQRQFTMVLAVAIAILVAACATEASDPPESPNRDGATTATEGGQPPSPPTDTGEREPPAPAGSVTMARANWSTGYMQAAIYAALLAELGFEVTNPADLELAPSNAYLAMANGEFDFWVNSWFPNHDHFLAGEMHDGSLVSDHLTTLGWEMRRGATQGLVISKSLAEDHGIRTLDQIVNDPDLFIMFDHSDSTPDDGVLQLLGCPEGWGCHDNIKTIIEDLGWTNVEQLEVASYDTLITEAISRDEAGIPYIALTWGPSAYLVDLRPGDNVVWLSIADDYRSPYQTTGPATMDDGHCSADQCNLGWDLADIRVTANNDFLAANPTAARLLELVEINPIAVAVQSVAYQLGEDTDADVRRHAAQWISEHRDMVDHWLAAARRAG